jgi:hypothetical protein
MAKQRYTSPKVEVMEVSVELGFAASEPTDLTEENAVIGIEDMVVQDLGSWNW